MSSSKLPQLGLLATGSYVIGLQLVGVALIAVATAFVLYNHIKKVA